MPLERGAMVLPERRLQLMVSPAAHVLTVGQRRESKLQETRPEVTQVTRGRKSLSLEGLLL